MNFSVRKIIQGLVAPNHRISCSKSLWKEGMEELKKRGHGKRESGAFLLGTVEHGRRRVKRFVYYDDLEPNCLETGMVVLRCNGYGPLWQLCRETGLNVVADVHTHPSGSRQSHLDKVNPMIALPGHIAIIVPNFALKIVLPDALGVYEYLGSHKWCDHSGKEAKHFFYIGFWG